TAGGVGLLYFFFSSRRRHTRWPRDWSSDVCSSDLSTTPRSMLSAGGPQPHMPGFAVPPRKARAGSRLCAPLACTLVDFGGWRSRSEERRVGKEGRARGAGEHWKERL